MDEEAELLPQRVSILNFLPPPPAGHDDEYREHVTRAKQSFMEEAVDETAEKRSVIDKKLFVGGRQDKSIDALTALANFVIFLEFISDDATMPEPPAIVAKFRQLGKMWSSHRFRSFAEKWKQNEDGLHTQWCANFSPF